MATKAAPSQQRNTLVITGYSVLAAGFLLACVLPAAHKISTARADIAQLDTDIKTRLDRTAELQNVQAQVELARRETRDFDRLVPESQELGPFLTSLYTQLSAAGMMDVSVRNLAPTPLTHAQKLPIEIHGKGTYAQFHDFLLRLENLPRRSAIGKLSIDADSDMKGNVDVQITLFIYSSKPS